MSDLVRRDDLWEAFRAMDEPNRKSVRDMIRDAEAVDAVPVVRCKVCKYAHMTYDGEVKYCDIISMPDADGDYGYALYLPGDWYCADGERRENDG